MIGVMVPSAFANYHEEWVKQQMREEDEERYLQAVSPNHDKVTLSCDKDDSTITITKIEKDEKFMISIFNADQKLYAETFQSTNLEDNAIVSFNFLDYPATSHLIIETPDYTAKKYIPMECFLIPEERESWSIKQKGNTIASAYYSSLPQKSWEELELESNKRLLTQSEFLELKDLIDARLNSENLSCKLEFGEPFENIEQKQIYDICIEANSINYVIYLEDIEERCCESSDGGGCLIATAAFGSEMAPQVQFLRELRDNTVLQTTSGTTFMTGFNQFYYSFSPQIADYERENPVFKEMVKVSLTPLLTSLTLLNYVEIDTEEEMLGYGIGIILLNVGMYFVAPAAVILQVKRWKSKN